MSEKSLNDEEKSVDDLPTCVGSLSGIGGWFGFGSAFYGCVGKVCVFIGIR